MEALGAAGFCIGDWVEQHKLVLGSRRVVGPELVLQTASISASDDSLTFDASTTFAHIRVSRPIFGEVTGSCLSDMIYPIMQDNPNLLGCTLDFVGAETDAICSVFRKKVSPKVGTGVTNFITPLSTELDHNGKRKVGCQFSSQRVKKDDVGVIHHERVFEVADCSSVLPVFSLPSLGWADAYYGFTTSLSREFRCGRKLGLLRTQNPCDCLFTLRGFSFMGHAWQEVQSQGRCPSPRGPASTAQARPSSPQYPRAHQAGC